MKKSQKIMNMIAGKVTAKMTYLVTGTPVKSLFA